MLSTVTTVFELVGLVAVAVAIGLFVAASLNLPAGVAAAGLVLIVEAQALEWNADRRATPKTDGDTTA